MKKIKLPVKTPTMPTIISQVVVVKIIKTKTMKWNGTEEITTIETDKVTTINREENKAEPGGNNGNKDMENLNNNSTSTSTSNNSNNKNTDINEGAEQNQ